MIQISYKDSRPIHEQVEDGIRRLVVSGALVPGEQLPSVRELASTLAINPNTIARAYRELEMQGYVCKVAGKGSFVSEGVPDDHQRITDLRSAFDEIATELLYLGIDLAALKKQLDKIACAMGGEGRND